MVSFLQTAEIERRAQAIWAEHHLEPCFDVERLLDDLDLGLIWLPLGRHEGLAVAGELLPDERKVLINQDLLGTFAANRPLLRFTLAHEIGHWLLHARLIIRGKIAEARAKDGALACRSPDVATSRGGTAFRLEYQASLFASHLLAPDALLLAQLQRFGCDGWAPVSRIGRALGMSPSAVAVRLENDGHAHKDEEGVPRPGLAGVAEQTVLQL